MKYDIHDQAAAIVSILIVLGVVVLSVLSRPVPSGLELALGSSITWLYVRSAAAVGKDVLNGKEHLDG